MWDQHNMFDCPLQLRPPNHHSYHSFIIIHRSLCTCPYHANLLNLIFSDTGVIANILVTYSIHLQFSIITIFIIIILFILVKLHIHLNIGISVECSLLLLVIIIYLLLFYTKAAFLLKYFIF